MATYYIDPSYGSNGAGTIGDPKNTWVGLTLTANNTYLQKRGTTYTGATVRPISQSSNAATPLTIGAYFNADGSDDATQPKPIIDHAGGTNGVGAVFIDTCVNVLVRDIAGTKSSASTGAAVAVRRSQGVLVQNCDGYDNEHGFIVRQDQASATSTTTDVRFTGCRAWNNVSGGITMRWGDASTAVLQRIEIDNCEVFSNGTGKGIGAGAASVPCGGIVSYTVQKATTSINYRSIDLRVHHNRVFNNNGYGMNIEAFGGSAWGTHIHHNDVFGNGYSQDVDSHSLWVGNCFGALVEENYVHDNYAFSGGSNGSGVGIFIDYNAVSAFGGDGNKVRRNRIERQWSGPTAVNTPGSGIQVTLNSNTTIESNLVVDCVNGINSSTSGTDTVTVSGNTVVRATQFGYSAQPSVINYVMRNNIAKDCGIGIFKATVGTTGFAETYNSVNGCTTAIADGTVASPTATTLHVSDITSDPLLSASYRPTAYSPLLGAGTHLGYVRDLDKKQRQNPPSIGAYDLATMRVTS